MCEKATDGIFSSLARRKTSGTTGGAVTDLLKEVFQSE
jgi:hypothetical protein